MCRPGVFTGPAVDAVTVVAGAGDLAVAFATPSGELISVEPLSPPGGETLEPKGGLGSGAGPGGWLSRLGELYPRNLFVAAWAPLTSYLKLSYCRLY